LSETAFGFLEPSIRTRCPTYTVKKMRLSPFWHPFTFHRVAGHTDMKTTMRYVHPSDADMDQAIAKAREALGGHTSGHTDEKEVLTATPIQAGTN